MSSHPPQIQVSPSIVAAFDSSFPRKTSTHFHVEGVQLFVVYCSGFRPLHQQMKNVVKEGFISGWHGVQQNFIHGKSIIVLRDMFGG
jgi:hypothetical protein